MNITRFAIENKVVTSVMIGLTLVAGLLTYFSLPRAEDPGFTVRTAIVTTRFPGASPTRVEQLVTDRLEKAIEGIEEIDFMESESRTGTSIIEVNVQQKYAHMDPIWDDLREKINATRPDLPQEAVGPFVNDDFGDVFSTVVMMTGEGFSWAEMDAIAEDVRARLIEIPYAAKVQIVGAQPERVYVEYDEARLAEVGLSASQLARTLSNRNILLAGGDVRTERERIPLEPSGNFETVDDIRQMTFELPGGALAALEDVATVSRGYLDPAERQATVNGQRALGLAVSMTDDGKVTELGASVLQALEDLRADLPVGIDFHTVSYRASIVDEQVTSFTSSLLQGMAAVLLVVLLFLGVRTGLVVASIVPITMVGSLLFMQAFGISMNKMSLAGLIVALGLLVDCAIVVVESIVVQMREGKTPVKAATDSVKELAFPLVVGVATTSIALLPTYIADHQVAEYTSAIFENVSIALFFSWFLALTVLPMLSVVFLSTYRKEKQAEAAETNGQAGQGGAKKHQDSKAHQDSGEYDTTFYARYRGFLTTMVRRPWLTLGVMVAMLGVAIFALRFVPQTFFPRKAETLYTAAIELPYGTPFERTKAVVSDLEAFVRDSLDAELAEPGDPLYRVPQQSDAEIEEEGVINFASYLGRAAPRYNLGYAPEQPRENYAYLLLNATSYDAQDDLIARMEGFLADRYPEAIARIEKLRNGPPFDYPVALRLSGPEPEQLFRYVNRVKDSLRAMPGVVNVNDNWGRQTKKLRVDVDDDRARRAGLTSRDVAVSLQASLSGLPLTTYREGEDLIPVVMRSSGASETGVAKLQDLSVFSQRTGQSVPLRQIADLEVRQEPSKIHRYNRTRTVTVQADVAPDAGRGVTPFSVTQGITSWLGPESDGWPLGYSYGVGGEPETSGEARGAIGEKAPLALLLIVLILVLEFNSLKKPAIILLTLPFALIGVVIGLGLFQLRFGFMAILGVIALFGIVINNAVVLIDRIDIEQHDFGRSPAEAVIEASQRRLRPILMTAATTIGGLTPLWLGGDVLFTSMAVAMIFGLLVCTLLTLGLVPVLYTLFFGVDFDGYAYAGAPAGGSQRAGDESQEEGGYDGNGTPADEDASTWTQVRRWVRAQVDGS